MRFLSAISWFISIVLRATNFTSSAFSLISAFCLSINLFNASICKVLPVTVSPCSNASCIRSFSLSTSSINRPVFDATRSLVLLNASKLEKSKPPSLIARIISRRFSVISANPFTACDITPSPLSTEKIRASHAAAVLFNNPSNVSVFIDACSSALP